MRPAAGRAGRQYAEPVAQLAKHLGIAFQILNDLQDWQGDDFNKLTLGGDVLGGRPTVLWALALEGLEADDRRELEQLVAEGEATPAVFKQIRALFQQAGVFEKALAIGRRASPTSGARGRQPGAGSTPPPGPPLD